MLIVDHMLTVVPGLKEIGQGMKGGEKDNIILKKPKGKFWSFPDANGLNLNFWTMNGEFYSWFHLDTLGESIQGPRCICTVMFS